MQQSSSIPAYCIISRIEQVRRAISMVQHRAIQYSSYAGANSKEGQQQRTKHDA